MRSLTILGSTGSIGTSTLDIVRAHPDLYRVDVLTAYSNADLLIEQAREFSPRVVVIGQEDKYQQVKEGLEGTQTDIMAGEAAIAEAASIDTDFVMAAIVGAAGLRPTLNAIRRGATVGLANKESLVCAGDLVMDAVKASRATLLPVDSEHNAIFQVFDFDQACHVEKIHLTASGGPFRTLSFEDMRAVTPEQAVAHPNWTMGAKISVDSASMMNKGLELIEAFHLFPVKEEQIEILVHPQSVIHSMVEYEDGSVLAQLGSPDMRTPIAYSMAYPARIDAPVKRLNFAEIARLDFEAPDEVRFPSLKLARQALKEGDSATTVLNAANEVAVAAFLAREIGFLDIPMIVEKVLNKVDRGPITRLQEVLRFDQLAREYAGTLVKNI